MYKKKIASTVILLVVCLAVLISASYAWLVISRAPAITGINTHIGTNGNLEIALLSDTTYMDPSLIRSSVGDSAAVKETIFSNLTWGNLIDLSDESYGLRQIFMYPSRLNLAIGGTNQGVVNNNMLMVPKFSMDGRINHFEANTLSAIFDKDAFTYHTTQQKYGVRGIGTVSNMTEQQSALAISRTLVKSYRTASINATESVWEANGSKLLGIYIKYYTKNQTEFSKSDVAIIRDTASRMLGAVSYVDSALRQGIIGLGASVIEDDDTFNTFKTNVANSVIPLSVIIKSIPVSFPKGFSDWVAAVETDKRNLQEIIFFCDNLKGDNFRWNEISPQLFKLVDPSKTYINDDRFSSLNSSSKLFTDNKLTLPAKSGIMSNMAEYNGNYDVMFEYADGVNFEVRTMVTASSSHLEKVSDLLSDCEAAKGDGLSGDVDLKDIYGFAIDIAFRCNEETKLLLQTAPALRVEGDKSNVQTQGEGSYMQFSSEQLKKEQITSLMDAMRIAFVDNQNHLLAVAKLNTSNYDVIGNEYRAPICLYEYSVSTDGSMSMGQRRDNDCIITNLSKSNPTIVTAIVWLDGDHVDNGLVASNLNSMTGSINLQFASDIELNAADVPVGTN